MGPSVRSNRKLDVVDHPIFASARAAPKPCVFLVRRIAKRRARLASSCDGGDSPSRAEIGRDRPKAPPRPGILQNRRRRPPSPEDDLGPRAASATLASISRHRVCVPKFAPVVKSFGHTGVC